MTRRDTAILAIRLTAIYAWFQTVEYVATGTITVFFALSQPLGGTPPFAALVYVLPCIAMFSVGLFLWLRARALAHHFVSAEPESTLGTKSSPVPLAFGVVGLAIFLYALPRAVSECITLSQSEHFGRNASQEFLQHLPSLAATAVQLVCGFILFVRPHRLARWWERKRDSNVSV